MKKDNIIATGQQETRLFQDACQIIEQAQESAYRQVNETLIKRNWLLGMRINMDVLKTQRAEYGEQIVKTLATSLTLRYGEGFTKTNLYNYIGFYQKWPEIFHAVSGKSIDLDNIFVLNGSDQLYAAKYLTYMPSRANLRREIEQQKEYFLLQHKGDNKE